MLKKTLIVFLLFLFLFFIFKDRLLKAGISYFLNQQFSLVSRIEKVKLNLKGITLEGFSVTKGDLNLVLKKARIAFNFFNQGINDLKISNCSLQFKDINASLVLEKSKDGYYILDIVSLKFKDKEIKNISISLVVNKDIVLINRVDAGFLGHSAHISGILDYRDCSNICLELSFKDTSFKNVINLFSEEKDLVLTGDFDGRLELCLGKSKISKLEGDFYNTGGGVVNIEREVSLGFLRRHLDKTSYNALVDNFKYYTYNKGRIKIIKKKGVMTLNLDFGSDELGRRNILINLHDISGLP